MRYWKIEYKMLGSSDKEVIVENENEPDRDFIEKLAKSRDIYNYKESKLTECLLDIETIEKRHIEEEYFSKIKNFIKQLRESDELVIKIFNNGSCYKLTKILKSIYPEAKALYSREDGHWLTKIENRYYDIGGEVNEDYVVEKGYEYLPQFEASADIPTYSSNVGVSYSKYK